MRTIGSSLLKEKGKFPPSIRKCVGAGRANELLRKAALDQLEQTYQDCGFQYLRFHGLFAEDMGVYKETTDGKPIYNFQYIDMLYDELLQIGIRPFVELSFMPDALASGTQTVFWWKSNVTPPTDYSKWGNLIRKFAEHLVMRYGLEEVENWYFEVWNEPNHPAFFSGTREDYFKMYDIAAQAIKGVSPSLQVGGPATAGNAWIPELIEHCASNQIPLDFISTHTYGVFGDFDEFGNKQLYLIKNQDCIIQSCQKVREQIQQSSMPDLKLHYTEWSASFSSRDPIHDTYIEAAYILYNLKRVAPFVDSMSYWTFTDIFEEAGIAETPFHGGFGLMNLESIKKPAYFAYSFLNQLGDIELECEDTDAYICKKTNDSIQILFWSFQLPNQKEEPNGVFFKRDLPTEQEDDVRIVIKDLEPGTYLLKRYQTGYGVNDVYTEYLKRGCNLERKQDTQLLQDICNNEPLDRQYIEIGSDHCLEYIVSQRLYDCHMITLEKVM